MPNPKFKALSVMTRCRILILLFAGFLGRISFALYLIHMPLLCSLGCGMYLVGCRQLGWSHTAAALGGAVVTVAGSLVGAWVFTPTRVPGLA